VPSDDNHHAITIEFCVPCDFRAQALELTRELLNGWAHRLSRLELIPSSGGRFEVTLDDELIFSKAGLGRHAEPEEVAKAVEARIGPRDAIA
jgi:selenoprotein W-related protein